MKQDHHKTFNLLMSITLMLVCAAFGVFLILNWKYISNPQLLPNYRGNSIFEYQEDLARFRHWGFFYPWIVLGFLIYFQTFLLAYLLIRKNLNFSLRKWIIILVGTLLIYFFPTILDFLSELFHFNPYDYTSLSFSRLISNGLMLLIVILFFMSVMMLFLKPFRNYTKFLAITFFTSVLNVVFIFAFMELFFD